MNDNESFQPPDPEAWKPPESEPTDKLPVHTEYKYILNADGQPVPEHELLKWANWIETAQASVASNRIGDIHVSTIFTGIDYSFCDKKPILWETMVFGGKLNFEQTRCSGSREQAEAMHAAMLERVRQSLES